jgi:hypothetical protein
MTHRDGELKSYRISPLRRSVLWMLLGPFWLGGVAMCFSPDTRLAGVFLAILMSVFLGLWQWLVSYTRLELSAGGVALRQFGWRLEAPWDRIDHLRMDRGREGFVVTEPMQTKGARRLASVSGFGMYGTSMYSDEQRYWMENGQWIPVEPFFYAFRKGPMKTDIERFAPGLLERDPAGMSQRVAAAAPTSAEVPPRTNLSNSRAAGWINGFFLAVLIIVPLSVAVSTRKLSVEFFLAFILGPLATLRAGLSCYHSLRRGSRLLGILFGLFTLVVVLFEVEFYRQWLHPK